MPQPPDPDPVDVEGDGLGGWRWWPLLLVAAGLPLLVLVASLAQRTWYPTGDLAQAELRMRSLPSHPPLVGAAGRINDAAGRQGSHPGPLMFWVAWPVYAILGRSAWALEAAVALVNLAWLSTSVWLVRRTGGPRVAATYVGVALLMVGGFGLDGLSQPWNPWVALLPFAVLVLTAWAALDGWRWAPVLGVASGSFAIQAHVGYAPVAAPLVLASIVAPIWISLKGSPSAGAETTPRGGSRAPWLLPTAAATLLGAAAWSGPVVDAWTRDPSNAQKLASNFGSPSEDPVGIAEGARLLLRTAAPFGAWLTGRLDLDAGVLPGLALLVAWAVVALLVGRSGRRPALVRLDAVIAGSLLFALFATSRIFGVAYLYVFRWATVLVALVVFTLIWGVATLVPRPPPRWTRGLLGLGLGLLVIGSVATSIRVADEGIPYDYSWRAEQVLAPKTAAALRPDTRYLVDWDDPVYLGGLGFGLLLDLERRGFDVGSPAMASTAIEPRRVRCPGSYDAVVTAVTGPVAIARWDAKPDARKVAESGPSDPTFDYDRTFAELGRALGGTQDPGQLERSLTLVVLNPAAPARAHRLASRLVTEGVPSAVFVQDPAPDPGPVARTVANEPCWK
ncbi:hypothetical protein BH10ACT1_BH10ACT1_13940 [soil metagenome]